METLLENDTNLIKYIELSIAFHFTSKVKVDNDNAV